MTAPDLSLCVGVTGHRDIDKASLPEVEARVRQVFARLKKEFRCPILVLSSLADGADRLVARVGLELGHELIVPLPLAPDDYARDFTDPASGEEFRALLARASRSFVADILPAPVDEEPRDTAYRSAGVAVARSCHVLLALWDGQENGKPGGTAHIVRIKRRGEHGAADVQSSKPHGAVIQVVTPRESESSKPSVAIKWAEAGPWLRVRAMARRIGRFNRDADAISRTQPRRVADSRRYLSDDAPEPPGTAALERMIRLYAVADALALRRQGWVRRGWRLLLMLGLAGVIALGEYAHSHNHPWQFLMAYVVVIAGMLGLYWTMKFMRIQPRFLEYRALAEALRVAFFWRIAGLAGDPADRYPGHVARVVEAVSMALRSESLRLERPAPTEEGLAFTLKHWVEGQRRFFKRAARRDEKWGHGLKLASNVAIGLGILVAVATLLAEQTSYARYLTDTLRHELILAMIVLPTLGGALATYNDRLGYESQSRQYERMLDLFDLAIAELREHAGTSLQKREVLTRLACEALSEHAHWVVLHRQRPFEVKMGG